MKKDKSTIIILIVLIVIADIGYFVFGPGLFDKYDKFKDLIVATKSGEKLQTEYSSIKDTNFFIKVPTEFTEMNEEDKMEKFASNDIDKVYINNDKTVSVLLDVTEDKVSNSDMEEYKEDIVNSLANYSIDSTEVIEIDKHNIISIVYQDEYEYHHALYFSYDGYLSLVSVNISLDIKDEWLPVSDFIIESLYFK